MKSPARIGHVVLKSYDVEALRTWYVTVLGGRVAYEKLPHHSFITYDDEHHRVAITRQSGPRITADPKAPGMHHMAFYFDSIRDLLKNYAELRDKGITPAFRVNHGPSVALYYSDPDGNSVEFGVDRFATAREAQDFIDRIFDRNPVGVALDPEALIARMEAGASEEELMRYDEDAPMIELPYDELRDAVEGATKQAIDA